MERPPLDAPASEWLVYADARQRAGDPRGELVVLSHAVSAGTVTSQRRDRFVAKHAAALLGDAVAGRLASYRLGWRHCVLESVDVRIEPGDDGAALVAAVLGSPAADELRELALVGVPTEYRAVELASAIAALAGALPPCCRSLALVDELAASVDLLVTTGHDPPDNLVTLGSLDTVWQLPVEHLRIEVADAHALDLGWIRAPALRSFTLRSLRLGVAPHLLRALERASWPDLESFELRLVEDFTARIPIDDNAYIPTYSTSERHEDSYHEAEEGRNEAPVDWGQLEGLLRALHHVPLRRLALTSFDTWRTLFQVLARVGCPPTLRELDVSHARIDRECAAWMCEHAELFANLERLVVERVPLRERRALASLAPEIVHSVGRGATYRHVVT